MSAKKAMSRPRKAGAARRAPKIQRWVDLLAALLVRRRPATFEELAHDVPEYASGGTRKDAVMRMFERDKDELRSLGIPIETVRIGDTAVLGYQLTGTRFYLPYLQLASRRAAPPSEGRRVRHYGYHSLQALALEHDELEVIAEAAVRARALGDPVLSGEVDAAIRKLALDLPLDAALPREGESTTRTERGVVALSPSARTVVAVPQPRAASAVFAALSDALARRKVAALDYYTIDRDARGRRRVEPYGLFFLSAQWYLAARDLEKAALRNFRLTRIDNVEVNTAKAQSPDYEIPSAFDLRAHARSRKPWEIGDGDATEAVVEVVAQTGATLAASKLGKQVAGAPHRRAFEVRRLDAFARWLLSFGGDVVPISPPELVREMGKLVARTLAVYDRQGGDS